LCDVDGVRTVKVRSLNDTLEITEDGCDLYASVKLVLSPPWLSITSAILPNFIVEFHPSVDCPGKRETGDGEGFPNKVSTDLEVPTSKLDRLN